MVIRNIAAYEKAYLYKHNDPSNPFYYYFDYDERSYDINMEFQHYHPYFYEICVFLDESAGHIIEGDFYTLECLDIVLLRPLLLHKTQYPQGAPNKRLIINFSFPLDATGISGELKHLFTLFDKPVPIYRFEGSELKIIYECLNDIMTISKTDHPLKVLRIHQRFMDFLTLIYINQNHNVYQRTRALDSLTEKIYSITAYIHSHYQDNLTLSFIAKKFFISAYYLSHQFKSVTGFTLTDYIQITRVRMVQNLLTTTKDPISDIAFQCGFQSFSQFNRVFRKHTEGSPSAYRRIHDKVETP